MLNETDRAALHAAILEYLGARGYPGLEALKRTLDENRPPAASSARDGTQLEKRWKTLQLLTKRNLELEAQCKQMERELRDLQDPSANKSKGRDRLPSEPCLHTFRGHRDSINGVCVHPVEPYMYSCSEDGTLRSWDWVSKTSVHTSTEHSDGVACVALEPVEGDVVATGSSDCTIKLFDARSLECVRTLFGHEEAVSCLLWVGDGAKTLISGGRDGVRVWDTSTAAIKQSFAKESWVRALAITNPNSPVVAVVGNDEGIALWNFTTAQPVLTIPSVHTNSAQSVVFSTYETDAVIIGSNGTPDMKESLKAYERSVRVAIDSTPKGATPSLPPYEPRFVFSAGRDKTINVCDLISRDCFQTINIHDNWVRQIALSGSGKQLLSCSDDGTLLVYDFATKRVLRKLSAHENFVTCFAIHYGHKPITVTGSADNTLKLWPCH